MITPQINVLVNSFLGHILVLLLKVWQVMEHHGADICSWIIVEASLLMFSLAYWDAELNCSLAFADSMIDSSAMFF